MPNAWVTHVKTFAANSNVSYSCAISMPECKQSYKKEPTKVSKTKEKEDIYICIYVHILKIVYIFIACVCVCISYT